MTTGCIMLLIAAAPSESARVGYVIDGDTFRPASGERIRIAGFDAPATDDDPKRFKERLGKLVKHKPVVKSQLSCNARSRPKADIRCNQFAARVRSLLITPIAVKSGRRQTAGGRDGKFSNGCVRLLQG